MALVFTMLFLTVLFVFKREMVPYNVYLALFSRYFGEIDYRAFLIFYYFLVAYIFSSLWIVFYDMIIIVIKNRRKNNA